MRFPLNINKSTLILSVLLLVNLTASTQQIIDKHGALVRSDTTQPIIYLCFTGHDFYDGFDYVLTTLNEQNVEASFFLTGDFVRNHKKLTRQISESGHFVGAHSDKHLLYNDWAKRDSLLHSAAVIKKDIQDNIYELNQLGIYPKTFMPPYEWYNSEVIEIAKSLGQQTVSFTYGTRSNADYTIPDMDNYVSSKAISESIYTYEEQNGMNGFHLLIHPGVSPKRTDKFYLYLEEIIKKLKAKGYLFSRFTE